MSPSEAVPLKIGDYHVLPIALPSLPSYRIPSTHYLYLRPHEPKIPNPSTPRSLFLVNVPIDATEVHLKLLFSTQMALPSGRIEEVQFDGARKSISEAEDAASTSKMLKAQAHDDTKSKKRKRIVEGASIQDAEGAHLPGTWDRDIWRSGSSAVIIFVDRASMDAVVKSVRRVRKSGERIVWGKGVEGKVPALGPERYLSHHKLRYPDKTLLLETVNNYMTAYANKEAARARKLTRQRQEPDEDGFVTVTRGGRSGPARQEQAQEVLEKHKERQKGLEDFYRFQSREKKKERAGELIKKFEEDREKVRKMRERRGRFKPE